MKRKLFLHRKKSISALKRKEKWSKEKKRKGFLPSLHFLFHFSKPPNLTDIDQDTKNDLFSIVFFVFNKALVPFVQIWAARKIILWILGCDEQILKKSLQGLPRWPSDTLFKKMHPLKTCPYFHFLCLLTLSM